MTTTPPAAAAAAAIDVTKVYGHDAAAVTALDHVSVGFVRGAYTAIMGPSGSGKSTLLHCLAGLDQPTSGQIMLGDTEISALKEKDLTVVRRDRIGFVFQAYNLVPTLSARENILLPPALAGRRKDVDMAWFDEIVRILGIGDRLTHRPAELSGGQQQRVAAARALIGRPDVIFADEPTGALDSRASAELLGFLRRASRELGQTIVMVTHDPVAAGYADRVVFLADGRTVGKLADPTPDTVLDRMKALDTTEAA